MVVSRKLALLARAMIAALVLACDGSTTNDPGGPSEEGTSKDARLAKPPKLILLLSLDTLRADRLGLYGHDRFTSPNLDMLGSRGVVFDDANSPAPWTLPAHASMLTGLNPASHGVMRSTTPLGPTVPTLASMLERAGYRTAAVVSVDWLKPKPFAVTREFQRFSFQELPLERRSPSSMITDKAIEWIGGLGDDSLFLFVHYYDLHSDYSSAPAYEQLFVSPYEGIADGTGLQLQKANLPADYLEFCGSNPGTLACQIGYLAVDETLERIEFDADDVSHLLDLYDASIRQLDTELARLFGAIRAAGLEDETLIIVTSDHGEEFGDHGGYEHLTSIHQEVLRVPLILSGPGLPSGRRIEAPVSTIDIVPTILGLLDVPPPAEIEGLDLGPLWQGDREAEAPFLARPLPGEASGALQFNEVSRPFMPFHRSLRLGRFKLIRDENEGSHVLHDLEADPGERMDVASQQRELSRQLLRMIETRDLGTEKPSDPVIELSPGERERLRALGYVP